MPEQFPIADLVTAREVKDLQVKEWEKWILKDIAAYELEKHPGIREDERMRSYFNNFTQHLPTESALDGPEHMLHKMARNPQAKELADEMMQRLLKDRELTF